MFALAVAAAIGAQPVNEQPAVINPVGEEIAQLEQQWGEAFLRRDFNFLERIVAPEYRLVVADEQGQDITLRAEWMKNARAFKHHAFTVQTLDVNLAGDTAVASAKGLWTVSFRDGMPPMPIRFFVTDTWVRRGGKWQVIHRYSHRLNAAPLPPNPN